MPKDKKKGKKPAPTWHDVNAARREGRNEGIDIALTILLTVERDNFDMSDEKEMFMMDQMAKLSSEIEEGRITLRDLKMVHLKEYRTDLR